MKGGSPHTPLRRPQNGTQAHDLSRELMFVRPAQVGATRFGTAVQPTAWAETQTKTKNH